MNVNITMKYLIKWNILKVILSKFMVENEYCHEGFDEEQNFKSHVESVYEGKKPYEYDICYKVFLTNEAAY